MEEERWREVRGVNSWSNCRISYVNVHVVRCAGSEVAGERGCAGSPPHRTSVPVLQLRLRPNAKENENENENGARFQFSFSHWPKLKKGLIFNLKGL